MIKSEGLSYLQQIGGYAITPFRLSRNKKYGPTGAMVWGVIWAYTQLANGRCYASIDTMAQRIGVTRTTFRLYRDRLIEDGYYELVNPERRGDQTAILVDTEKLIRQQQLEVADMLSDLYENLIQSAPLCTNFNQERPIIDHERPIIDQYYNINTILKTQSGVSAKPTKSGDPIKAQTKNKTGSTNPQKAGATFQSKHAAKKSWQKYQGYVRYRRDGDDDYSDPRLYHPALRLFRGTMKQHVTDRGDWRDKIIREVGDKPNALEIWKRSMELWIGTSENYYNLERILSIFRNGGVMNTAAEFDDELRIRSFDQEISSDHLNPLGPEYQAYIDQCKRARETSGLLARRHVPKIHALTDLEKKDNERSH